MVCAVASGLSTNATVVEEEMFPRPVSMICAQSYGLGVDQARSCCGVGWMHGAI